MTLLDTLKENKSMKLRAGLATIGALLIGIIFYIISAYTTDNTAPLISLPHRAAAPTPTPIRAEMYTMPLSIETTVGRRFNVTIAVDAKNTVINGTDSVISYDPTMLRVVQVTIPTNADKSMLLMRKQIENGKIYITAVKSEANNIPTQELPIARLSVQALKSGTTTLIFDHMPTTTTGSTVIQADESKNILDKVTNTTIIIK